MLGSSGGLAGGSGDGEVVVGSVTSSSIMGPGNAAGVDDEKGGGDCGDLFEGGSGGSGNRWPRQETIALLKIRSDMDTVFRDSSLKGPLWEEVSRKMGELGYHRSGKKCKEKFENVYKYHKRTKEGRTGKSDGKTYRFFDQLEALEQHHSNSALPPLPPPPPPPRAQPQAAVPVTMVMPGGATVPSSPHPISVLHIPQMAPPPPMPANPSPIQMENSAASGSPSATPSSSSSTSSDEELLGGLRKRKRKWKDFFERVMKEVIEKQDELQKKFLEAVEKRELDRAASDEAWKAQEQARLNKEHEILVHERSMAAAKDAALISFLQKLSEQQHIPLQLPTQLPTPQPPPPPPPVPIQVQVHHNPPPMAPPPPPPLPPPPPIPIPIPTPTQTQTQTPTQMGLDLHKSNNGNGGEVQNPMGASSSRWPKAEVQALIDLRTRLDQKYLENGPKGALWEEISSAMKKLGYNRNAKRCKEKWENINKYFKKVKERNKKRAEDSKTCPYFHQLDALYREKNKADPKSNITSSYGHPSSNVNLGNIPAQAQQQWPNPEDSEDEGDDEEEEDEGSGYEIVANNAAGNNVSVIANANATSANTASLE